MLGLDGNAEKLSGFVKNLYHEVRLHEISVPAVAYPFPGAE